MTLPTIKKSGLDDGLSRDSSAITYYFLMGPSLIATLILTILYYANLDEMITAVQGSIPFAAILDPVPTLLALIIPGLAVLVCFYALLSFRPAVAITSLTLFYLIVVSVTSIVDGFLAAFIVISAFTCLIGFNYSREVKVRAGRKTMITSTGPGKYVFATYGFDILLPIIVMLGTIGIIAYVMDVIQMQVNILPEPLGALGSLYLQSRLYLMLTTLSIAGAIVWMIRQFFEPILLRFTLTVKDAREYLMDHLSRDLGNIYWLRTWRPTLNPRRIVYVDVLLGVFIMIVILTLGSGQGDELLKVLGLASPQQPNLTGYYIDVDAKLIVRFWDQAIIVFQDVLRKIMKILWG